MPRPERPARPSAPSGLDLSDQLRSAIQSSGRSESDLAREATIDPAQVHRFMSGLRDLRLATVSLLCEVLGLRLTPVNRPRGRPVVSKTDRSGLRVGGLKATRITFDDDPETDHPAELSSEPNRGMILVEESNIPREDDSSL